PTFGGINLEDIKAPECFEIESRLRERMNIPVLHDDQHGTAIIVGAAVRNALALVGKSIAEVRLVASGAGAAALACLDLLLSMGLRREHVVVTDIAGVVYEGREELMDRWKARYAVDTDARTLAGVIGGADIFLGLSAPRVLEPEHVGRMAESPIILALANPVPEILPDVARKARRDVIIATGRSDYPNQVNNVLCFPFIFRGALDVGATEINEPMKLACVDALAGLARREPSDLVTAAYGGRPSRFGPNMLIPRPFDPRLLTDVAPAVARAAMSSGVATRPIDDFDAYRERLTGFVFRSGLVMKPLFERARSVPKRVIYGEGEERRVLQAVQQVVAQGLARPILVGRPKVILSRIESLGLDLVPERDFDLVNILHDARFRTYWSEYHRVMGRSGVSPDEAKHIVRSRGIAVAALAMRLGDADAMLCGTVGTFHGHLRYVRGLIGTREGVRDLSTMSAHILPSGTFFICDTHITPEPSAEEIVEMTMLACTEIRAFGMEPKVALLSRSNFGTHDSPTAERMRRATRMLHEIAPDLELDGEMHTDAALSESIRSRLLPDSRLKGQANLLVMPNVEAANIAHNLLRALGGGVSIGPIVIGAARSAHVVTQTITVRGLVNMTALAVAQAGVVEREMDAWEWRKRLAERSETELGVDAATLIAEARELRDRESGSR
ncbi:MAG: phosphate acyltransferase, partial [Gammaproteobacteria bacterium]|nr:phosphate acyltransferase [Gammaproteobacteria bacterium]